MFCYFCPIAFIIFNPAASPFNVTSLELCPVWIILLHDRYILWSQCRSPERVKKMLWNSRQVIYRNINVRGDGLISLNFITMPSFLLYKHIKPAVIQVPYCKIVPRRCPSLELFCIFYLTVKNIIKFSPIFFQCTSCILNWIFDRQIA